MIIKFIIPSFFVFLVSLNTIAQCKISASNNVSIYCGQETEISAEANWSYTGSFSSEYFTNLQFVNEDIGYSVATQMMPFHGVLLKTIDGGNSWIQSDIPSSGGINDVYFTSVDTGYVAGDFNSIYRTTNGGISWNLVYSSGTNNYNSIFFVNDSTGFVGTSEGTVLKTSNYGLTWNSITVTQATSFYSMYFINENIGFVGTGTGEIFKTSDGGNSWVLRSNISGAIWNFTFMDQNIGFSYGQFGKILKTVDAGETWFSTQSNTTTDVSDIDFLSNGTGIALVGSNSGLYLISYDNGLTWENRYHENLDYFAALSKTNANTLVAIGNYGKVMQYSAPISYFWTPNNFIDDNLIKKPLVNPNQSGKYFVTATFPNGCTSTDSVSINVSNFTVEAGQNKTIICGDSIQMDNVVGDINLNYVYNWFPQTGINNPHISNPKIAPLETTNYLVTLSTSNGCVSADSVRITVNPFRVYSELFSYIICGASTGIQQTTTNHLGAGAIEYAWYPSLGISDTTLANPIFSPNEQTTYRIVATTHNGCIDEDSTTIFVTPINISATSVDIQCGDSARFLVSTNYNGLDPLTYSWTPAIGLSDTSTQNPWVQVNTTQEYFVSVNTLNGCESTAILYAHVLPMDSVAHICLVSVNEENKNIVIWNKSISQAIDTFIVFRETNFTNQYERIGEISYDSLSIFVDTNSNPTIQSNKYRIAINDQCGMESLPSTIHKTMHLSINQGVGSTWNLIWEAYEGFEVISYKIYRGTSPQDLILIGSTSGTSNQYSDFSAPSGYVYYQVEVLTNNICIPTKTYFSSRSNIATNNVQNVQDYIKFPLDISPNPCSDFVSISFENTNSSAIDIKVYNLKGELVLNQITSQNQEIIDLANLTQGIYFIEINIEKAVYKSKLVKL